MLCCVVFIINLLSEFVCKPHGEVSATFLHSAHYIYFTSYPLSTAVLLVHRFYISLTQANCSSIIETRSMQELLRSWTTSRVQHLECNQTFKMRWKRAREHEARLHLFIIGTNYIFQQNVKISKYKSLTVNKKVPRYLT